MKSMVKLKNSEQIEVMRQGGKILAEVLKELLNQVRPGVSELQLDQLAEKLIREKGAEPAFKRVPGYSYTICASTNDVVVHGIPTDYKLQNGDILGVDCGVYYEGFYTDSSETVRVQNSSPIQSDSKISAKGRSASGGKNQKSDKTDEFLQTGKRALEEAIKVARIGNRIGHISKVIQDIVEKKSGYFIVRSLVGHGVGRKLHEAPEIPGFLLGPIANTPLLKEGMTLAIEVIYNLGTHEVVYANNDNWTIKTKDRSLSAVFERTVAVTKEGPIVLTE